MSRLAIASLCFCLLSSHGYTQVGGERRPLPFLAAADGEKVYILVLDAPREMRGFNVYRKGPVDANPALLTPEPVRPVADPYEAMEMLGGMHRYLVERMKTDDPRVILQRLRSDPGLATVISMLSPAASRVAGRWFVDSLAGSGPTIEYTVALLGPGGKEIRRSTRSIQTGDILPARPAGLQLSVQGEAVRAAWTYEPYAGNPSDYVIGFHVYRSSGGAEDVRLTAVPVLRQDGLLLWVDRSVRARTSYSYRVTAVDILGREGAPSDSVEILSRDEIPPPVPAGLQALPREGAIRLSWSMKPDEGLSHFNVYRGTIPEDSLLLLNRLPIPAATPSFVDTTVIYGPDYVYRVTAVDSGGNESKRSVSVMARPGDATPPPSPMMVLVAPRGKFTELSWTKPRARDLKGYYVFRGSRATDLIRIVRTHLHPDSTRYLDRGDGPDGLPPGESYVYGICAIDNAHNESNMVLAAFRTPDRNPPAPPNDFRVSPTAGGDIQLLWQPSASLDVVSYTVYRGEDTLSLLRLATVKGHAFRDSSAVHEARYLYRITALDSSKNESVPTPVEAAVARPLHRRERPNK